MKDLFKSVPFVFYLIMILFVIIITGCSSKSEGHTEKRFETIAAEHHFRVLYDKESKVQYAISNYSYNSGNMTLLVDKDGSPLLYKEEY